MSKKITERTLQLLVPLAQKFDVEIWDVEYIKEGANYYLRIYLDSPNGLITLDDCENVSRGLEPELDKEDFIPQQYYLEVCSAGIERELKRPEDFEKFMSNKVKIKLYTPKDGKKEYTGILKNYENGTITLDDNLQFNKAEYSQVRLSID